MAEAELQEADVGANTFLPVLRQLAETDPGQAALT